MYNSVDEKWGWQIIYNKILQPTDASSVQVQIRLTILEHLHNALIDSVFSN